MGKAVAVAASSAIKKVFIFFSSSEISDLLAFSLENRFQCEARSFTQAKEAVPFLKSDKFELAVLDISITEGMLIFEQVRAAQLPFVIYHPDGTSPEVRGPKIKAFKEKELLPAVEEALRKSGLPERKEAGPSNGIPYSKISLLLLLKASPLPIDIFIKLSELKFVKLFRKETPFDAEDKTKYHDHRKIPFLYVRRDALPAVADAIANALSRLLQQL